MVYRSFQYQYHQSERRLRVMFLLLTNKEKLRFMVQSITIDYDLKLEHCSMYQNFTLTLETTI